MLGISVNGPERNRRFAKKVGITFPLLSDTKKTVSKQYGVLSFFLRVAKRATFVVDRDGVIRHIDRGAKAMDPAGALAACRAL